MSREAGLLSEARGFLLALSGLASVVVAVLTIPILFLAVEGAPAISEALRAEALRAVALSLEAGALSATLSTAFGVPLAYILSRLEFRGKGVVEGILDLPLILPHTVAGIAVLLAFSSRSPIGSALAPLGLRVEDSFWGIVLATTFVSAPFAVDFSRRGFDSVDVDLELVARSLGASPTRVFLTVSLPLASRAVATGWLMSMARAVSEVGAVMVVAYHPTVGSVLVLEWLAVRGLRAAAGLSLMLLAASLAVLAGLRFLRWFR